MLTVTPLASRGESLLHRLLDLRGVLPSRARAPLLNRPLDGWQSFDRRRETCPLALSSPRFVNSDSRGSRLPATPSCMRGRTRLPQSSREFAQIRSHAAATSAPEENDAHGLDDPNDDDNNDDDNAMSPPRPPLQPAPFLALSPTPSPALLSRATRNDLSPAEASPSPVPSPNPSGQLASPGFLRVPSPSASIRLPLTGRSPRAAPSAALKPAPGHFPARTKTQLASRAPTSRSRTTTRPISRALVSRR